jgi:hypothetical protein
MRHFATSLNVGDVVEQDLPVAPYKMHLFAFDSEGASPTVE